MAISPGTRLGVFEIAELIGAGGMGEVYRAPIAGLVCVVLRRTYERPQVGEFIIHAVKHHPSLERACFAAIHHTLRAHLIRRFRLSTKGARNDLCHHP